VAGAGADDGAGAVRTGVRCAGSLRAGARVSEPPCGRCSPARWFELEGAVAGATAAGGVSVFEWKKPSWLKPVIAAVIDPTSAAAAVRYPGAV
jgi:hypothetical protein